MEIGAKCPLTLPTFADVQLAERHSGQISRLCETLPRAYPPDLAWLMGTEQRADLIENTGQYFEPQLWAVYLSQALMVQSNYLIVQDPGLRARTSIYHDTHQRMEYTTIAALHLFWNIATPR